jgi:hypothetical protein
MMLVSGCILLLTVVIPHHHHEDGTPCIFWWDNENKAGADGEENHCHSCECNGHTIAFHSTSSQKQASETHDDPAWLFIPLHTLFDYINPPLPFPDDGALDFEKDSYAGSLYCAWLSAAAGFRAPPLC